MAFKENPTLDVLRNRIQKKFPEWNQLIMSIVLWGSRVYGTHRPESDYDFQIILDDSQPIPNFPPEKIDFRVSIDAIDIPYPVYDDNEVNMIFYPRSHFLYFLYLHRHEGIEFLFAPPQHIWFQKPEIQKVRENFVLDPDLLKRTVLSESKVRYITARNKFTRNEVQTSKKFLFHAIRYKIFAIEAIKNKLQDFGCANWLWEQINSEPFTTWKQFDEKYGSLSKEISEQVLRLMGNNHLYGEQELQHRFFASALQLRISSVRLANHPKDLLSETNTKDSLNHLEKTETTQCANDYNSNLVKLLLEHGLFHFLTNFPHILVTTHPKQTNLFHFRFDTTLSLGFMNGQIEEELGGGGLILDSLQNWRPVCRFFPKIVDQKTSERVLPSLFELDASITIYEQLDGLLCGLFYSNGIWNLTNSYQPNECQVDIRYKEQPSTRGEFHQIFWELWQKEQYQFPCDFNCTYIFELCTNLHRKVAACKEGIYLLGVVENTTGKEKVLSEIAKTLNFKIPNVWAETQHFLHRERPKESFMQYMQRKFTHDWNPLALRGLVLLSETPLELTPRSQNANSLKTQTNNNNNHTQTMEKNEPLKINKTRHHRVKMIPKSYFSICQVTDFAIIGALNWMAHLDERMGLELLRLSQEKKLFAYYPEYTELLAPLMIQFSGVCDEIDSKFRDLQNLPQKEFGKQAEELWYAFILHAIRTDQVYCAKRFFAEATHKDMGSTWRRYKKALKQEEDRKVEEKK